MLNLPKGSSSLCLPANFTWVSQIFKKDHTAYDFGYSLAHKGSHNQDLVAVSDAMVVDHLVYRDGGNTAVIGWNTDENTWYAEYMHNKYLNEVPIGTLVKQGQKIGTMRDTGSVGSFHTHFILVKAPLGTPFDNEAVRKYRVEPITYPMYVYPGQDLRDGSKVKFKTLPKDPIPTPDKGVTVGDTVIVNGKLHKDSNGRNPGSTLKNFKGVVEFIVKDRPYPYHIKGKGWVSAASIGIDLPTPTPTPKPTPKDQYVNMKGNVALYVSDKGNGTYPAPSTNKKTFLQARSAKILETKGSRFKVSVPTFNPKVVWVEKSQVGVSDKPQYKIH